MVSPVAIGASTASCNWCCNKASVDGPGSQAACYSRSAPMAHSPRGTWNGRAWLRGRVPKSRAKKRTAEYGLTQELFLSNLVPRNWRHGLKDSPTASIPSFRFNFSGLESFLRSSSAQAKTKRCAMLSHFRYFSSCNQPWASDETKVCNLQSQALVDQEILKRRAEPSCWTTLSDASLLNIPELTIINRSYYCASE